MGRWGQLSGLIILLNTHVIVPVPAKWNSLAICYAGSIKQRDLGGEAMGSGRWVSGAGPPVGGGERALQHTHTDTGRAGCLLFSCSSGRGAVFNCNMIL